MGENIANDKHREDAVKLSGARINRRGTSPERDRTMCHITEEGACEMVKLLSHEQKVTYLSILKSIAENPSRPEPSPACPFGAKDL